MLLFSSCTIDVPLCKWFTLFQPHFSCAWSGLTALTGFRQIKPEEGQPATQRTEVFLGYTDDTFYVGVICYDEDPERIIVTDSRRDSSLAETDSFQLVIDGLYDRQNGLVFGTNPAGIELASSTLIGTPPGKSKPVSLQSAGRRNLRFPSSHFVMG